MSLLPEEQSFIVNLKSNQYKVLPPSDDKNSSRDRPRDKALISIGDHVPPYVDLHVRGTGRREWSANDVTNVVDRYLKAAEYGSNAHPDHPPTICPCCQDRNQDNIKQRVRYHLAELPETRPVSSGRVYEDSVGPDVGIYRSESPDLTLPGSTSGERKVDNQSPIGASDPDRIYVINPMVYEKYPYPVHKEITGTGTTFENVDRIIDASSKFNHAMKRLNSTIDHMT